jgi:TolB-like protein
VILSLVICSCSTVPKYLSFDDALGTGIEKIGNDLPEGTQVAILDFKSDNENLSSYIIEEMYDKLVNLGKLIIMERGRTNTIAMEVGYQLSGEVDDNQIINIGHQLGADYVVTGQIIFSGEAYRLRVFAIDIERGRRVASSSLNINRNDRQITYLLGNRTEIVSNARNEQSEKAVSDSTRQSTWSADRIVSPSEAKELFNQILNGNYPPIAICGSQYLRKEADPDGKILFTTNFNRIYYDGDDAVKIVRVGDGWGWDMVDFGGGEFMREASLTFLKNSMSFIEQYRGEMFTYTEMVEELFDYGLETMLIIYTGNDGNKYVDITDW